ncbi:type II secretion system F family protein [Candidatus Omnitrophota bacterium]
MALLIYLAVFISVFILTHIFIAAIVPPIVAKYNKWQGKRVNKVAVRLEDSFIFLEKQKLMFLAISPVVFGGIFFILLRNVFGFIIGFLIGLAFPGFATNIIRQMRLKKFSSQMVDSLMILSSSLRGGLSLIQAIEVLCEEMPPPISQEFNLILQENKWGVNLEESLQRLRTRMPLEEVNLLVSSVLVARETGGELTRVFTRLIETIRNNIRLKEKIATLTLQGRLQGVIMSILPVGFAFFINKQQPDHFDIMWESYTGRKLLVTAVVLQILGIFLIKKISTLKV